MRKQTLNAFYGSLLGLLIVSLFALFPGHANATNPNLVNFQGKVVNGSGGGSPGTNVADGSYTFRFCLYSTATPTTPCTSGANNDAIWKESKSLSVTSGVFQTELGDVTTLPDFSSNSNLYLGVNFNGDAAGEMTPRIHLDSVPFAKYSDNSGALGGLAAGNFVQLAQGLQTDSSTTNASIAINKTGSTANILVLQKSSTNVLLLDNNGLLTVQPAASLTGGQTAVTQTLTNGDATGGTVIGYNQTISVSNTTTSGVTTGIKITLTDNTSLAGNTNTGIDVRVIGSNTSQAPTAIIGLANNGEGIRGRSGGGGSSTCGSTTYTAGIGTCGESLATGNSGTSTGVGVFGTSKSGVQTSFNNLVSGGAGTVGLNEASGTASSFYVGVKGQSTQTAAAAYSSAGVFGQGNGGAGATIYGGYFQLGTSGATAGAALYASNNTVAATILNLQDNTTDVLTVRDGGLIGIQNTFAAMVAPTQNNTSTSTSGGTLAATTYYYKITAIDSVGGETASSAEKSQVTTGAASTVTLSWVPVSGASGYKIYRGTTALGGSGSEVYLTTTLGTVNGANLNYVDTGSVTAGSATPPTSGTAYTSTNNSNALGQIIVGGNGTPTGQVYVSGILPKDITGGGVDLSGNPSGVYISGKYAYIPDGSFLKIFDVSTPSVPVLVGSVGSLSGPRYVTVQGRYAYVSNNGSATMSIIDVSNPSSPSTLSSVTTAANPRAIYVQGRYAYVAALTGNTLQVIDISNPSAPYTVGSTSTGSSPLSIFVQGNYAYVVITNKLQVFNVSNPSAPTDVSSGGFSIVNGPAWVYVQGKYAYVVTNGGNKLLVLDISSPGTPVDVTGGGFTVGNGPQTIYVQGRYAYITLNNANKLQVVDISNPAKPFDVSGGGVATGTQPFQVVVSGRYAYVINSGSNKFQVFDLGGTYSQQLEAGGAEFGTLNVDSNANFAGDTSITGGLTLGSSLQAAGSLSTSGSLYVQGVSSFAGGILGGTTINNLSTPGTPTVTTIGTTGAQTWKYRIVAINAAGQTTPAGSEGSTTSANGVSTLTTSNYQQVSWSPVAGAVGYKVYRTAVAVTSPNPSTLGCLNSCSLVTNTSLNDTGLAGDASSFPTTDNSGNFTVNGLVTLQPATSLIAAQSAVTSIFTNASSTGGTVNGYSQTITVSNTSSASTTNGFNISLTDNASSLANINTGIAVNIASGSNASQSQIGISSTVARGISIKAVTSGNAGSSLTCGTSSGAIRMAICAEDTSTSSGGSAISARTVSNDATGLTSAASGAAVIGLNSAALSGTNAGAGIKGITNGTGTSGTYAGVVGVGSGGAGSTAYGGYFTLTSGGQSAGAALYASNQVTTENILDLQDSATSVFTVGDGGLVTASTNSVTGFVVKDSSSTKQVFTIDTSGDKVLLGKAGASGLDGKLVFNNATNSNTATIVTGVTAASGGSGYTLTLPTTGASSSGQCLQSDTGSTVSSTSLTFSSCGAGGGTLKNAYDAGSTNGGTVVLTSTGGGLILQDASTPITGTLFGVQSNLGSLNFLTLSLVSSVPHLRVYDQTTNTNYAEIYFDHATSTAIFKANGTNATQVGNASGGAINIASGSGNAITITAGASSTWSTSAGTLTIDANGGLNIGTSTASTVIGQTSSGTTQVQSAGGLLLGTASVAGKVSIYNGANNVVIQSAGSTAQYTITLPSSSGSANYCLANTGTAGVLQFIACGAGSTGKITLVPEYPGAVMTGDGTSNTGTMTSDFCSGSSLRNIPSAGNPCAASEEHNYYTWVTTAQNDYDIWVRWQVPTDFADFAASNAIQMYGWRTDSTATTSVTLSLYNASGTLCGTSTNVATGTATWTQTSLGGTVTAAGCSISSGNVVEFRIQMAANNKTVRAGEITINYQRG